jgi:putative toxin-antitoxin system antitoxin component (TIGR02293 family)
MVNSSVAANKLVLGKKPFAAREGKGPSSARAGFSDARVEDAIHLPPLEQHDLAVKGILISRLNNLHGRFTRLTEADIAVLLGVSKRAIQRRKRSRLTPEESGTLLDLLAVRQLATDVLGDQEAAETWLLQRAVAFEGRRPIELLATRQGANLVKEHLTRIEHGVYV